MIEKEVLYGKTKKELQKLAQDLGLPKFTANQLADWMYKKHVFSFDQMTNISLQTRKQLKERYRDELDAPMKVHSSVDGTKKYLFKTSYGKYIEAAYIPDKERHTLCVSSQVGCKMGCLFCMTGKQGFQGNLSTAEILNQILAIPEWDKLSNIVYMGMGEPLDNLDNVLKSLDILTSEWGFAWSPKRITVSTIGIIPGMKEFLNKSNCHLAVSLHTPFEEERKKLMPIENVYALPEVIDTIKSWDFSHQRRVSFEYILFKGLNDSPQHIKQLAKILNGIKCRINLIRFHEIPDSPLKSADQTELEAFRDALNKKGITSTIRASRGEDIYAACGLLSTKELLKKDEGDH